MFFFFKQKTAYEMRISDWSSDVCSSDLHQDQGDVRVGDRAEKARAPVRRRFDQCEIAGRELGLASPDRDRAPVELGEKIGTVSGDEIDDILLARGVRGQAGCGLHGCFRPVRIAPSELGELGSASCRERVCQYVVISGVGGSLKKKKQ